MSYAYSMLQKISKTFVSHTEQKKNDLLCLDVICFTFSYWSRFVILTGLREAPQLATLLREMKEGLDVVRSKVEALTAKVPSLVFAASYNIICFFCEE